MSYLFAADAVAHLERNGDVVLTGHGELILCCFLVFIFLCAVGIMVIIVDEARKQERR